MQASHLLFPSSWQLVRMSYTPAEHVDRPQRLLRQLRELPIALIGVSCRPSEVIIMVMRQKRISADTVCRKWMDPVKPLGSSQECVVPPSASVRWRIHAPATSQSKLQSQISEPRTRALSAFARTRAIRTVPPGNKTFGPNAGSNDGHVKLLAELIALPPRQSPGFLFLRRMCAGWSARNGAACRYSADGTIGRFTDCLEQLVSGRCNIMRPLMSRN